MLCVNVPCCMLTYPLCSFCGCAQVVFLMLPESSQMSNIWQGLCKWPSVFSYKSCGTAEMLLAVRQTLTHWLDPFKAHQPWEMPNNCALLDYMYVFITLWTVYCAKQNAQCRQQNADSFKIALRFQFGILTMSCTIAVMIGQFINGGLAGSLFWIGKLPQSCTLSKKKAIVCLPPL